LLKGAERTNGPRVSRFDAQPVATAAAVSKTRQGTASELRSLCMTRSVTVRMLFRQALSGAKFPAENP
jgi:hypothetical protein